MSTPSEKRHCHGMTKAGKPCTAHPLHDGDYCLAHDEEARALVRFGGAQPGSGRPRNPRPAEVARQLIERNARILLEPHFRTLGYEIVDGPDGPEPRKIPGGGAKLYGMAQSRGEIVLSEHDDLGAMQSAAERLLDRVYGKPKQSTEISGPDDGPVRVMSAFDMSKLTVEERRELLELLEKTGA